MRISDAVIVDREFRYYRKAQTLITRIQDRMSWYLKNNPSDVRPLNLERADRITKALEDEIAGDQLKWIKSPALIDTYLFPRGPKRRRTEHGRARREPLGGPAERTGAERSRAGMGAGGQSPRMEGPAKREDAIPLLYLEVGQILDYIFEGLPPPRPAQMSDLELAIIKRMTDRNHVIAANRIKFLIACEIAYRHKQGWYMIFNTLTVAPEHLYEVFRPGSTAFKNYVRRFNRYTTEGDSSGHGKGTPNTYAAVTEEGGENGRLHIHVLHFFPSLPSEVGDPNIGKIQPTERCIPSFCEFWPYGRSEPRMVRYHPRDAWGRKDFRWPIDTKTGMPLVVRSPLALASYCSKYITKGYASCQRSRLLWRVKKTQNLGIPLVRELVEQLSTSTLLLLASTDSLKAKLNNSRVPSFIMRIQSLKTLQSRRSTKHLKSIDLTQMAKQCLPRLSPLHYSRASIETILEYNQQSSQFLETYGLNTLDTFKEAWKELYTEIKRINDEYFPVTLTKPGAGSVRDFVAQR